MKFNLDNLVFWGILILIIFIPLYPKFPLAAVAGTYVAIRLEDILISVVLMLWFFANLKNLKNIFSKTVNKTILLFWLIGLLSVISGVLITNSVKPHLGLLHFLRRVEMMSLFIVAATSLKERYQLKSVLLTMLIVTFLVSIYGFGQIYLGWPVVSTTNREYSKGLLLSLTPGTRPNSTFAGHYDLAAYLSIVVVFIGSLFFYYKKMWEKLLLILSGGLSFVLLGLTAARVSFLAALVGLAAVFWLSGKRLLILGLILASVAVVIAVPQLRHRLVATVTVNLLEGGGPKYQPSEDAVNQFTPLAFEQKDATESMKINESTSSASQSASVPADIAPGEPINTTELGVYRSFNIRTDVEWPRAIRSFYKNPFLGTGYSSITIATDNDLLRALGETGLLGLLSLLLIVFILLKRFVLSLKKLEGLDKLFIISAICTVVVVFITGLFIDILEASKIASLLWIFLGLSWTVAGGLEQSNSNNEKNI